MLLRRAERVEAGTGCPPGGTSRIAPKADASITTGCARDDAQSVRPKNKRTTHALAIKSAESADGS